MNKEIEIPDENAKSGMSGLQKIIVTLVLFVLVYAFVKMFSINKTLFPYYLFSAIYLIICFHRFFLTFLGFIRSKEIKVSKKEIDSRKKWPRYTVLLPVYKEDKILVQLVESIKKIDYPSSELEVIFLLEEDDIKTQQHFANFNLPSNWKKILVPDSQPKTKGKALDFGLKHATGKYVVIYDAEDIPERDQLKKAVIAFDKVDSKVVCLQSKLNYYNPYQNSLTEWFTVEYSTWFDIYLPGIDGINAPVPLGGTSNHFKADVLRNLKGWDPFNVTEDCDLGIRIFKEGYKTRILDTTTWEEANSRLMNWIKQRSRWEKGYIQTYFVHMKKPFHLIKKIGLNNFLNFNFIVGGNFLIPCLNLIIWIPLVISFLLSQKSYLLNTPFFQVAVPVLLYGNLIFVLTNLLGVLKRKYYRLILPALLSPFYWILMSIGAWKGLLQYIKRPFFWEKTNHGLFTSNLLESEKNEPDNPICRFRAP